jgi:phosphotransferase system HPr-like phosphotransfer protein
MQKFTISLSSINEVKEFCSAINELDCEADLKSGKYLVDAKSIMGIFSLDFSDSLELTVHTDADISDILCNIKKFIVKEL